jgi:hypothetical protein
VKLTLPFGVISDAYYTRLNINTAVWRGVNLEFARGIQETSKKPQDTFTHQSALESTLSNYTYHIILKN